MANITKDGLITDIIVTNTDTSLNLTENPGAAATLSIPAANECKTPIVDNTLSITIKTANKTVSEFSELQNNIFFRVPCIGHGGVCDESFQCIWYDKNNNRWLNNGCNTTIDPSNNEQLICECSHLTTFAT
eukprot:368360_1